MPPPPPARSFPPLSGPSRTFAFERELRYPVRDYTKSSRFVLYDNGAFVLQYSSGFQDRGEYHNNGGAIVFDFEGWTLVDQWAATGTLEGGTLIVEYHSLMSFGDYDDAVYVLVP